jgi:anti-sigma regulatory factor (Ser/Thr protein kinase)
MRQQPTVRPPDPVPVVPVRWIYPAQPESVSRARGDICTAAIRTFRAADRTDDRALLASELVTNAILHGALPAREYVIEATLWRADGYLWLAVSDAGDDVILTPASS